MIKRMTLAMVACAMVACSSTKMPAPGATGSSGTSGGVPFDASGGDGAIADGPSEAAPAKVCHEIPNNAPAHPITFSTSEGPPASTGGAIADGTYFLTSEARYGVASMPSIMSGGVTLVIAGGDVSYGKYTTDDAYLTFTAKLSIERADAGGPEAGEAGSGDTVKITETCPAAGSTLGPQAYSVVGNDFTLSFGTYTLTYTKQ